MSNLVIVDSRRTAIGEMMGSLSKLSSSDLASHVVKALIENSGIDAKTIDTLVAGCVLPAGMGQAPARQVVIKSGLQSSVQALTVNKVCGSGLAALFTVAGQISSGQAHVGVALGMENMSAAPYLLPKMRSGARFGHAQAFDHMLLDGLEDAYETGTSMGVLAERCVDKYSFTREMQDEFAIASLKKSQEAIENGYFADEVVPIKMVTRKTEVVVDKDELPQKAKLDKIPKLRPAFIKDGTITAANASAISDGAAGHLIMTEEKALELGLKPMAKIVAMASHSHEPQWFTTAPVDAMRNVLHKAQWKVDEVDLFEINEAFACVPMAAIKDLGLDSDKVNIHGGACALGHPIGASGARIVTTLLHALKRKSLSKGVASLCIGGGEGIAAAFEIC